MHKWGRLGFVGLTLGLAIAGRQNASALTKEDALENCRATVGRPIVQACIRGGGGSREACREQASPKVRACVIAALNAANGLANVPIAVPKEQGPSDAVADRAEALPSIFVVPPRTITDITAILDSEKPDAAQIAKLHTEADAAVPANVSRAELAQFYYQRGNARAQLGRLS